VARRRDGDKKEWKLMGEERRRIAFHFLNPKDATGFNRNWRKEEMTTNG